jgi:hypothetical protein
MTQPPYRPPDDHSMRRFALFVTALIIIVAIGSQTRHGGVQKKSICVCIPARAGLILKSAIARTQALSTEPSTSNRSRPAL